jgi:PTS system N-acetylgalactosamine-specific IIA component
MVSTSRGVVAVVAGHGQFAEGLVSAVHQITGRGAAFTCVSNAGLAPADLEAVLRDRLDASGVRVIFTDLPAGSCTMAARRLQRARPEVVLVTGVNLAVLLEYLFSAEAPPGTAIAGMVEEAALARAAADKGRATLVVSGGEA